MNKQIGLVALVALLASSAGCKKEPGDGAGGGASGGGSAPAAGGTIKVGQTMAYSGPASAYGMIGKADQAYMKMINDKGGVNGRKIEFLSVDDGYSGPKTVEATRKLVESDNILIDFGSVGTAPNAAVHSYLNEKKVPQLFVASGGEKWADPAHPWTIGWQPSYGVESKVYARYVLSTKPGAKMCVLYQNDDFGKDMIGGLKQGFGAQFDKIVVKTASYEVTDPTVDSQIVTLQAAGCDTLLTAASPKFAAQSIRKVFDIGWKPLHLIGNVGAAITTVLKPAGLDKSTGLITGLYLKDPSDPAMASDPGIKDYLAFMKQYMPGTDPNDSNAVYGYGQSMTFLKVLTQCGDDLSRENVMKQARNLVDYELPVALPGIKINTSPTDLHPFSQVQLAKFDGQSFVRFGAPLSAD
jgi:branched-chain amino acid transport system substrate-binding protein